MDVGFYVLARGLLFFEADRGSGPRWMGVKRLSKAKKYVYCLEKYRV